GHGGANRPSPRRDSFRLLLIVAATEPDGSKSPQQAHLALLRMIDVRLTAFGPQLGLRRTRQFVDARHPARPIDRALRRRRDEGARSGRRFDRRRPLFPRPRRLPPGPPPSSRLPPSA